MARATPERPDLTDQDLELPTEYEQQFLDVLGPTAGPEAYLNMTAILEMFARIPDPAIASALHAHIAEHGINRNLVVAESSTSIVIANSPDHARYLRRTMLFRKLMQLGEAILHVPQ